MKEYKEKMLIDLLNEWFSDTKINRNTFNQTEAGKLLREKLEQIDRWKVKPRGKPNDGDNLNKTKKEMERLAAFATCKCGAKIERYEKKSGEIGFLCANIDCNLTNS